MRNGSQYISCNVYIVHNSSFACIHAYNNSMPVMLGKGALKLFKVVFEQFSSSDIK